LDEQQKLKNQLPQGLGGAIKGAIERELVGSVGWERTAKRIGDLKKQAEELSKVLKTFPTSDEDTTGGGVITPLTSGPAAIGLEMIPTIAPGMEIEKLSEELFLPKKDYFEELGKAFDRTSKTMEEQSAFTTSVMLEDFQEFSEKVGTALNSLSGFVSAINQKASAELENESKEKNDRLDEDYETNLERIENSTMNVEERQDAIATLDEKFAGKKEALDEQMAKKELVIKRRAAIMQKATSIFNVIVTTIEGVMKAVATSPLTGGMPMSAIIGGFGAAQVAAIASTPLPLAMGGLISGPVLGLIGEGSGTSAFNPEVVSPLDKLMGMMGATQVDVHGRIAGDNIILVSDKAEISRQRFI
jgi:hypothetical protein